MKQMKQMLKGSDKIAQVSYDNYQCMDLKQEEVPAILVYGGIQYTYIWLLKYLMMSNLLMDKNMYLSYLDFMEY